ncbi:hypothetical protein VNO77_18925 [Canavalia gladiata]|uniref:Uncharacterized protein n=1 Tax=Canavalia gladiata TaxID=3824 RepID=A0AAN9LQ44_CANGL
MDQSTSGETIFGGRRKVEVSRNFFSTFLQSQKPGRGEEVLKTVPGFKHQAKHKDFKGFSLLTNRLDKIEGKKEHLSDRASYIGFFFTSCCFGWWYPLDESWCGESVLYIGRCIRSRIAIDEGNPGKAKKKQQILRKLLIGHYRQIWSLERKIGPLARIEAMLSDIILGSLEFSTWIRQSQDDDGNTLGSGLDGNPSRIPQLNRYALKLKRKPLVDTLHAYVNFQSYHAEGRMGFGRAWGLPTTSVQNQKWPNSQAMV